MDKITQLAPSNEKLGSDIIAQTHPLGASHPLDTEHDQDVVAEEEATIPTCAACEEIAAHACYRCEGALCEAHSYREEGGTRNYCRACADAIVGVCDVCDALHARGCRECGTKVCETHHKRVIERWGWGGAPGQGGFMSWFPVIRTYCQQHGRHRFDLPKPKLRTFKGYDGSSPEW